MSATVCRILDSEGVTLHESVQPERRPVLLFAVAPRLACNVTRDPEAPAEVLDVQTVPCRFERTAGDGVAVYRLAETFRR